MPAPSAAGERRSAMRKRGIPTVRNTVGEHTLFSLDRFVRDAVLRGDNLERAREAGRQFLADAREAAADIVTTDGIRHWLLERDPLIFARRRCLRERDLAGRLRYTDPILGAIATLAETVAEDDGRLLTELFLDYFRPGAGDILFQDAPDERTPREKAPDVADLEKQLRDVADGIAFPERPDYTGPGGSGPFIDFLDPGETRKRLFSCVLPDDTLDRFIGRPGILPKCDERWLLFADYSRKAPGCVNVNYRQLVRAALLQAIAEAFRVCRLLRRCEAAMPKLLHARWFCGSDIASARLTLEVVCMAA
jgi:hypothetical protein